MSKYIFLSKNVYMWINLRKMSVKPVLVIYDSPIFLSEALKLAECIRVAAATREWTAVICVTQQTASELDQDMSPGLHVSNVSWQNGMKSRASSNMPRAQGNHFNVKSMAASLCHRMRVKVSRNFSLVSYIALDCIHIVVNVHDVSKQVFTVYPDCTKLGLPLLWWLKAW